MTIQNHLTIVSSLIVIISATLLHGTAAKYFSIRPPDGVYDTEQQSAGKISSGYLAKPGEFPSYVSLKAITKRNTTVFCAGAIIDERTILTAAHCFWYKFRIAGVYAATGIKGFMKWNITDENVYKVAKICQSSKWSAARGLFDIAILTLERSIKFSSLVKPMVKPIRAIKFGDPAFVVGAGVESLKPIRFPEGVKVLPVKVLQDCGFRESHESHVCFIASDKRYRGDACLGDSGGPVYANIDGKQYLYGLTSYGPDVCREGVVNWGVYSDVYRQSEHIHKLAEQCAAS